MTMESTKKRDRYIRDLFEVHHIDDVPKPEELIKQMLEDINFQDRKEEIKADRCFKCGSREDSLLLILPKVKKNERGYRHFETFKGLLYDICTEEFDRPSRSRGKNANKLNDFILDNWDRMVTIFEEEFKAFRERYTDLTNYITVCERCNSLIYNFNLYLCGNCKDNLHPAKYDKCFSCVIEEEELQLCPICKRKYYNPSNNNKCRNCRD